MTDGVWMHHSVKFTSGEILRQYDPVEVYNSKLCRDRFPDAQVDSAFNTLRMLKARGGDNPKLRPVIIIHCGRLYVVEAWCLTTTPPPPPVPIVPTSAGPTRQKVLF